jgi:hypothetical protein
VHGRCFQVRFDKGVRLRGELRQASPDIERVCSAGFLSQMLQEHYSAGGTRPGLISRADMSAAGAPTGLTQAGKSNSKKARGHVLHMQRAVTVTREALGRQLTKAEQADVRKVAAANFRSLSPDSKHTVQTEAETLASQRHQLEEPVGAADATATYEAAGILWGVSSRASPLRQDVAEATIKRVCECDSVGGVTSYGPTSIRDVGPAVLAPQVRGHTYCRAGAGVFGHVTRNLGARPACEPASVDRRGAVQAGL